MDDFLTTKQAAERLGMSEANVRKMCADGRIEAARMPGQRGLWLIKPEALEGVQRSPSGRKAAKKDEVE